MAIARSERRDSLGSVASSQLRNANSNGPALACPSHRRSWGKATANLVFDRVESGDVIERLARGGRVCGGVDVEELAPDVRPAGDFGDAFAVETVEPVTEQLDYVPASFRVIRHVRPRFSCLTW